LKNGRIGILGGTFNPPHIGHLILAQEALIRLRLDKVIFIPTYLPPHKKVRDDNAYNRYKMAVLACKGNPNFAVSKIEIGKSSVSYSVETLRRLKKSYGKGARLFFLVGSDNDLKTWRDIEVALDLATFVVANRPGSRAGKKGGVRTISIPSVDISSSEVRKRVRLSQSTESIRYLVPESVRDFIKKNRLYK